MPKRLPNLRQKLIEKAMELAREEGLSGLKLRDLAHECDIALGTLYNYYPTKDALVLDVVQQFWQDCFHQQSFPQGSVIDKLDWLYQKMKQSIDAFSSEFLHAASGLSPSALEEAQRRERMTQRHLIRQLAYELQKTFPKESEAELEERAAYWFTGLLGCLEDRGYSYAFLRRCLMRELEAGESQALLAETKV